MSKIGESILRGCANLATARPWRSSSASRCPDRACRLRRRPASPSTPAPRTSCRPSCRSGRSRPNTSGSFPQEDSPSRSSMRRRPTRRTRRRASCCRRPADRPELFERVEVAGSSPYFDRYGLLFLDPDGDRRGRRRGAAGAPAADQPRRAIRACAASPASWHGRGRASRKAPRPPSTANMLSQSRRHDRRAAPTGQPAEMPWREVFGVGGGSAGHAPHRPDEAGPRQRLDQPRRAGAECARRGDRRRSIAEASRRHGARHRRAGAAAAGAERRILRRRSMRAASPSSWSRSASSSASAPGG